MSHKPDPHELNESKAQTLAGELATIVGFRYSAEAVNATAADLVRWCKGAIIGSEIYTAEDQAQELVTTARQNWPTWQGTAALHQLFREKFGSDRRPQLQPIPYLCARCQDSGTVSEDGVFAWCGCKISRSVRFSEPDLVARLNNPAPVKPEMEQALERLRIAPIAIRKEPTDEERALQRARQKASIEAAIATARETLDNPEASLERKQIATEALRLYGSIQ